MTFVAVPFGVNTISFTPDTLEPLSDVTSQRNHGHCLDIPSWVFSSILKIRAVSSTFCG
jgi:hypothetical protein